MMVTNINTPLPMLCSVPLNESLGSNPAGVSESCGLISVRTSAVLTEPFANGFKLNAIFLTEKRRGLKTENSHMVHDPYWISYEMVYLPLEMFIF